jgi:hypothetical protein
MIRGSSQEMSGPRPRPDATTGTLMTSGRTGTGGPARCTASAPSRAAAAGIFHPCSSYARDTGTVNSTCQ